MSNMCSIYANINAYMRIYAKMCGPHGNMRKCAPHVLRIFSVSQHAVSNGIGDSLTKSCAKCAAHILDIIWHMYEICSIFALALAFSHFFAIVRNCSHNSRKYANVCYTFSNIFVIFVTHVRIFSLFAKCAAHILDIFWNMYEMCLIFATILIYL